MKTTVASKKIYHTYQWSYLSSDGEITRGELQAPNIHHAKAQLHRQNIRYSSLQLKTPTRMKDNKKFTVTNLASIFKQLAVMLKSGIPLVAAFNILLRGHTNPTIKKIIEDISHRLQQGNSLTQALKAHPKNFEPLVINLIDISEQSGTLDIVLEQIAQYMERSDHVRKKLKKAMLYPSLVIGLSLLVTIVMLALVIPQFESLYQGFGAPLPFYTRAVLSLAHSMEKWWWLIVLILFLLPQQLRRRYQQKPQFAEKVDAGLLKLPIIKNIIRQACIARFSRTLATTSCAGLPIVSALNPIAKSLPNAVYRHKTEEMLQQIKTGTPISQALSQSQLFPEMAIQMIAAGEESGKLDEMLNQIANFYEEELESSLTNLTTLLEPLTMVVLGVIIGGLISAMYLPIFQIGNII